MTPGKDSGFSGRVVSGRGEAAYFTSLDWVVKQCREKLGFVPFPGTLNLETGPETGKLFQTTTSSMMEELLPPSPDFCPARIIPGRIVRLSASGSEIPVAIVFPATAVRVHDRNIVELLAPVNLRQVLGRQNGDRVEVRLGRANRAEGPKVREGVKDGQKNRAELVMFDLDGTLIDSTWIYYEIVHEVMRRLELPQPTREEIGRANRQGTFLWEKLFPEPCFRKDPGLKEKAWEIARQIAPGMFERKVRLLPGAAETVHHLAASGRQLAIVTATPAANMPAKLEPLRKASILELFATIVTADDTESRKPEPGPLLECCRRLDRPAESSVYVGDTRTDLQAGRAAGTLTIGITTGFDDREMLAREEPDLIIDRLAELMTRLPR